MTRSNGLLRLTARLIARRDALRRGLAEEVRHLRDPAEVLNGGDPADVAAASADDEICSRIAEIESRELVEIEEALRRLAEGTYGRCESCGGKIPSARLSVLPCTTRCIACQRRDEAGGRSEPVYSDADAWSNLGAGSSFGDTDAIPAREEFSVHLEYTG